jgi:hypothetical protein
MSCLCLLFGGAPTLLLYIRGRGYKESPLADYNYNSHRTLFLVFTNYKI